MVAPVVQQKGSEEEAPGTVCLRRCEGPPLRARAGQGALQVWPLAEEGGRRALGFLCLGKEWRRGMRCRPPAPGGGATPSSGAAPQGSVPDAAVTPCEGSAVAVSGADTGPLPRPPPGCAAQRGRHRAKPAPAQPGGSPDASRAPPLPARTTGTRGAPSGCPRTAGAAGPGPWGTARGSAPQLRPHSGRALCPPLLCLPLPSPRPHHPDWGEPSGAELNRIETSGVERNRTKTSGAEPKRAEPS